MDFWGYVDIASTVISIGGAISASVYYDKSKKLTLYANTNIAFVESQKIITNLNEMLKLSNGMMNVRGRKDHIEKVCSCGEAIRSSIDKIREIMSVEDYNDIKELLNSQEIEVEKYIASFITGSILVNEKLVLDDNFNLCQQKFYDMQLLIKKKLENISKKLK